MDAPRRHQKVIRLRILKPADGLSWPELGKMLREVRYRVYRLANLAVSENYLNFHMFVAGRQTDYRPAKLSELSKRLRIMYLQKEEARSEEDLKRFSKTGALPATVQDALAKYKIGAITAPAKWREIVRGKSSLPTFRLNMAIPIRCDKRDQKRLERVSNGDVHVDLMICTRPYPRVVLQTNDLGGSAKSILERLLANPAQSLDGYRQRCFEVKLDERTNKWWLFVTYDFPALPPPQPSNNTVVGVDLGFSCPLYAAINNGHARLGRRHFAALAARIRSLQRQVQARRRNMLSGGNAALSAPTARAGHGRRRRLAPIRRLEGRIDEAYKTLNHQLSATVIDFARNHGAGVIQIEDLGSLKEQLRGTFIGMNWRYHQLQQFLKYKADEAGIEFRAVNPRYTSRRCSACGHINMQFDRAFRDRGRTDTGVTRFRCPQCNFEADPDYNAAKNLAVLDIDKLIAAQCKQQGIVESAL